MSEHTCAFCRIARIMNVDQIERYVQSKKSFNDFVNDEREDQISSDVLVLMREHERIKAREMHPVR